MYRYRNPGIHSTACTMHQYYQTAMMRKHVPVSLPCMYDHEFKINSRITSITPQNPPVVWTPHDALSRSLAGAAFVSMGKAQPRQGRSGQV
jgi:hypothetical protein